MSSTEMSAEISPGVVVVGSVGQFELLVFYQLKCLLEFHLVLWLLLVLLNDLTN